jgi:hypothetical protein
VRSVRLSVAVLAVVVLALGAPGQLLQKVIFAATGTRTLIYGIRRVLGVG